MTARRSALLLCVAAALGGLAMGLAYDLEGGLLIAGLIVATGAPVLALSHLFVRRRERFGSLSHQFMLGIGLAIGLGLTSVGVIAMFMFVSRHDGFTLGLLLAFAGVLAAYSSSLLASGVMKDIEAVRDCLEAVGEGSRDSHCETAAQDELAELAVAANRMIGQLKAGEEQRDQVAAARRDLIAAVSHDLRTPLTSLQLLADAVGDNVVDEETRRHYIQSIALHVRSLSGLVEDLFELSRLEAGDITWSMRQVHLDELVQETVDAMRLDAEARGVSVATMVPDDLAPARANAEKVQRVLFNLIQNAIRHTPSDGSVTIAASSHASTVEIEVADTGAGVPATERDRVFEPFYRGGPAAARGVKGAGLGLTICRAIVEAHGGSIWLADSPRGTRVRFSLPLAG